MCDHHSWHPLPVSHPELPVLLVSPTFDQSQACYSLHITDLANMWVERLDRRAVCMRAFEEETPIDPSQDIQQMAVFMDKLRAAFDPSSDEHHETSLKLATSTSGTGNRDDLILKITCILPKPLKPLRWPMYLKKCPSSAIAAQLVLPLMRAHHARQQETELLISKLKDKDAVITRVVDKLEATGTGLEYVFNSLKRKTTREVAESRIKGLAAFDESDFRENSNNAHSKPPAITDLVQDTFSGKGLRYLSPDGSDSHGLDEWWVKLGSGPGISLAQRKKEPSSTKPEETTPPTKTADDDDDFQVQATPPARMSARKRDAARSTSAGDDASTEDEGGDVSQIPDSYPLPKPATRSGRVGTLGRTKESTPADADVPMNDAGSETASDPDDAPPPSPPPKAAPARRGGVGRIGGKKAQSATPEPAASSSPVSSPGTKLPPKRRVGVIGKLSAASESPKQGAGRGRSRTPAEEKEQEEEKPRETSLERADRRRRELQQDLDKKTTAPAKKKRKF